MIRVVVAGAGLAGLTCARHLERAGASVTVVEARDRVGGRVYTLRDPFLADQHVEAGADLIEDDQVDLLALVNELKLERVRILRSGWGFYGGTARRSLLRNAPDTFERAQEHLRPEIEAFKTADQRWESGVSAHLSRQSVDDWLRRTKADAQLRAAVRGLRGFFLADPEDLSLLPLVEQFASEAIPGEAKMFRLRNGNDSLARALADALRGRVLLNTVVLSVAQSRSKVRVAIDDGRRRQLAADFVVLALPATTLRNVEFEPALHPDQRAAFVQLRYGAATRVALQFDSRFWRRFGRPSAFGTDQPFGAVWDGNEQQGRKPGILTFLAGGRASKEIRAIVAEGGWPALVSRLRWLGRPSKLIATAQHVWEADRWSKGGYAVFSPSFDIALRPWLARPAGRAFFAGEHTSRRSQGFMNGAVESGRRAAIEVAMAAGLSYSEVKS